MTAFGGRAFGLDIEAPFEILGVDDAPPPTHRRVRLDLGSCSVGERAATRISEVRGPDGHPLATVDALEGGGYALGAEDFGRALVSADGTDMRCDPADLPAWRWQRFLTGQALPLAALLHGLEVLHASAVVLDGRAVGIVAGSGVGKTTAALELLLRGLPFLNDDVLVLEPAAGGGLMAHPGPAVANVRRSGDLAERLVATGLGRSLGASGGETRLSMGRHERPVPLGALFFLERTGAGAATVERLTAPDPRLLLAATFNLAVREPARLARQLEVCGRIAESAALFRVSCPDGSGAAAAIHEAAAQAVPS